MQLLRFNCLIMPGMSFVRRINDINSIAVQAREYQLVTYSRFVVVTSRTTAKNQESRQLRRVIVIENAYEPLTYSSRSDVVRLSPPVQESTIWISQCYSVHLWDLHRLPTDNRDLMRLMKCMECKVSFRVYDAGLPLAENKNPVRMIHSHQIGIVGIHQFCGRKRKLNNCLVIIQNVCQKKKIQTITSHIFGARMTFISSSIFIVQCDGCTKLTLYS